MLIYRAQTHRHCYDMDVEYQKEILSPPLIYETEEKSRYFNLNIAAAWCIWVIVCSLILLCILPLLFGTSLWMTHIRLVLEPASNFEWTKTIDEGLELFSFFSSDLSGISRHRSKADFASISTNTYTFDFASWCRKNSDKKFVVCYRGEGLNIVSAFVTDIGAQIAEVGHSDDPRLFGVSLSLTYRRIIKELDGVFHSPNTSSNSDLDMQKLRIVHVLHVFENLGQFLLNLRMGHAVLMVIISVIIWTREILAVRQIIPFFYYSLAINWTIYFLLTCSGLLSCCFFSSEVMLVCRLNMALIQHGIHLRLGPGNILLLGETILGILLTFTIIFSQ